MSIQSFDDQVAVVARGGGTLAVGLHLQPGLARRGVVQVLLPHAREAQGAGAGPRTGRAEREAQTVTEFVQHDGQQCQNAPAPGVGETESDAGAEQQHGEVHRMADVPVGAVPDQHAVLLRVRADVEVAGPVRRHRPQAQGGGGGEERQGERRCRPPGTGYQQRREARELGDDVEARVHAGLFRVNCGDVHGAGASPGIARRAVAAHALEAGQGSCAGPPIVGASAAAPMAGPSGAA